ncbi:MAG: hydroxyacylglutathione hydrolase [Actinomycetota bacterium]|jgi:glyoxylase-like metal-dependent hydrolase (beta-lactamase superfamily II)
MPPLVEGIPLWVAGTNAWIVSAQGPGGECVLVDAPPDPSAIVERLTAHGMRLVAIFGTHGHVDHVGGIGTVARTAPGIEDPRGVPVHIHDDDRHMLIDPVGTSGGFGQMLVGVDGLDLRPPEIIEPLDDGMVVKGAGMTFTTLHTPGHTKGSVCLKLQLEGAPPILFSGDHLFAGSIGRTDMPGGSFEALMHSMEEKILPLDDETAVLPGHGPTTTIGRERMTNPFIIELLS